MEANHNFEAQREQGVKALSCKDCPGPKNIFRVQAVVDLVDGTKLNAEEVRYLCEHFGVLSYEYGGSFYDFILDDIDDRDSFKIVLNYGHEVQIHVISGGTPVSFVLKGLKGKCGDIIDSEGYLVTTWYARVETGS